VARIVVPVLPFGGHVAPVLGLVVELVGRGHDVVVHTGAKYAGRFTAVGARWEPWRQAPDFDDADLGATFPGVGDGRGLRAGWVNGREVILGTAAAQTRDLVAFAAREPVDAVVADQLALGGALAAEVLGAPLASVAVVPLALPSRHLPPSGTRLLPARTAAGRARDAVLRAVVGAATRRLIDPVVAGVRREVGLGPAAAPAFDGLYSTRLVLAQGVPGLDYPRPDLPPAVRYVGRLAPPPGDLAEAELPGWWPEVARARAEGRPVVHVSQGTLHVDPDDLLRPTLAALADSAALVVATTGRDAAGRLGPVPPNARVAAFVPHDVLLPQVDVMVSNGGWSSVLGAVAAGVPLVVAGGDLDKPEVARRVAWSGAGVDLRTRRPGARRVRAAVDRVLADAGMRRTVGRLAEQLAAAGGAGRGAELVEDLLLR
jgi:UDP:flavonoid glycosyltransferase YjiC (YdhE family)